MKQLSTWQRGAQGGWPRTWGGQSPASCSRMDSHPEAPAQPFSLNKRDDVIPMLAAELEGGDLRYVERKQGRLGLGVGKPRGR